MCYSGTCYFENRMGDCTLMHSFNDFRIKYGCSPCLAGGYAGVEPELVKSDYNYGVSAMIKYKEDEREKNGLHGLW